MEFEILMDILRIFMEVHKISTKHGKIMASIVLVTICVQSMIYLLNVFSTKPLISDFIVKGTFLILTPPNTPEYFNLLVGVKDNIKILLGVEGIFILVNLIASLLLSIATVFASALLYGGKYISPKDLLQRTIKSWKRPFVTGFYTTLFVTGYVFLFLATLLPLLVIVDRPVFLKPIFITLAILASIFYTYLAVVWTLAFIISVLEDSCGIEALGKAAQIVKGMKLQGFILNLVFTILSVILFQGLRLVSPKQSTLVQVSIRLIVVICSCLARMIGLMAYTVFYHKCKKIHGEEVELQGSSSTEYVKVASMPLINESIP